MDVGKRLKQIRLKRNLTLAEVGERINKTEATMQRYESGNIKNLKADTIEELARVYEVSPAYIMGWENEKPTYFSSEYTYYSVNIPTTPLSDTGIVKENDIDTISIPDIIMGKWAGQEDIFIIKVNGESMNKIIPNNSLIAVKCADIKQINDRDIVLLSDKNDYSIKHFYNDKENERYIFRPNSKDESFVDYVVPYEFATDLKIYGKVVVYIISQD
ncbi:XRE family transcriptional regulator [Bacillus thuringiensis]|uniref:XRE family transcriptional regulator n=2 Tax=Bacillus thuringiensis TaxID=1428 RepID=UPI0014826835|nr:helix-turn-helix domain-containing protein [Bacillus thuringiensis]MED2125986.1 helix-turn-helix domain-containing protein [Bacillus thuringiensis]MED2148683.1 helix-turn-helix domain-containing protein [Bacillus thuringiensis]MED2170819.1 helix-turn-helix domain-containing protein [Bacillus thuringiensis]MED2475894.1 helix-turn-helix domain-containing protein [Bacillus thuringiensis]MED2577230.1 helix-turn-helix domain-containing protein [Bacillus thuringiensis]